MSRYVAFLRGMNLGRRRIKNDELCACFAEMGFEEVSAFLASGNVIFDASGPDAARTSSTIEEGLERSLDYKVPTFLRTAAQVRAIAEYQPFSGDQLEAGGKPQVVLLGSRPGKAARESVLDLARPDDLLAVEGSELYWLPSGSILDSELDFARVEKLLGTTTTRTKRTLERIAARFLSTG
jgi:uncharacterized protein (DUF1697 family)